MANTIEETDDIGKNQTKPTNDETLNETQEGNTGNRMTGSFGDICDQVYTKKMYCSQASGYIYVPLYISTQMLKMFSPKIYEHMINWDYACSKSHSSCIQLWSKISNFIVYIILEIYAYIAYMINIIIALIIPIIIYCFSYIIFVPIICIAAMIEITGKWIIKKIHHLITNELVNETISAQSHSTRPIFSV
jgi:hypothetical protein